MKQEEAISRMLADQPLFSSLSEMQMARVKRGLKVIKLGENETLFNSKEPAERFFVLRKGQMRLFRRGHNGAEKTIEIIRPGETFATAVMFMEKKVYPVSACALRASQVLSFENRIFLGVLRESPETCFRMMADMGRHMRRQLAEIDQLSLQCAPSRLAAYLLEKVPKTGARAGQLHLDTPKQVIASRLSIQPETFSRVLGTLKKKGLIEVKGGTILVPDIQALETYTESKKTPSPKK